MRTVVKQIAALVHEVLGQARKAVDVPVVHAVLSRFPGGQVIRMMIEGPTSPPLKFEPRPVTFPPPRVPVANVAATAPDPARVDPGPSEKVARPTGRPPAAKPPVPVGTQARMLTGAFKGWTGPLKWSPAKSAYNVKLTGPDGQQARTTLSPSRLGTSWEVESTATPTPQAAKQKRRESQV
jgi:hypothetical protein